uniref:Uncharacterized protein n=1 Tax=Myoviridae sp. ctLnO19 TaxID=2825085 RepID=A0A8S5NZZ5_9CAUD|nr:MAG TPA: hypothetical protein [Myoviridae sp. ctLnO19]
MLITHLILATKSLYSVVTCVVYSRVGFLRVK